MVRKKTNYERKGFVSKIAGAVFSPPKEKLSDEQKWRPRKTLFSKLDGKVELSDQRGDGILHSAPSIESETTEYKRENLYDLKKTTYKQAQKREHVDVALKPSARDTATHGRSFVHEKEVQTNAGQRNNFSADPFENSLFALNFADSNDSQHTSSTRKSSSKHDIKTVNSDPTDFFSKKPAKLTEKNLGAVASSGIENQNPRSEFHQFTVDEDKESTVIFPVGEPDKSIDLAVSNSETVDDESEESLGVANRGTRIQKRSGEPKDTHPRIQKKNTDSNGEDDDFFAQRQQHTQSHQKNSTESFDVFATQQKATKTKVQPGGPSFETESLRQPLQSSNFMNLQVPNNQQEDDLRASFDRQAPKTPKLNPPRMASPRMTSSTRRRKTTPRDVHGQFRSVPATNSHSNQDIFDASFGASALLSASSYQQIQHTSRTDPEFPPFESKEAARAQNRSLSDNDPFFQSTPAKPRSRIQMLAEGLKSGDIPMQTNDPFSISTTAQTRDDPFDTNRTLDFFNSPSRPLTSQDSKSVSKPTDPFDTSRAMFDTEVNQQKHPAEQQHHTKSPVLLKAPREHPFLGITKKPAADPFHAEPSVNAPNKRAFSDVHSGNVDPSTGFPSFDVPKTPPSNQMQPGTSLSRSSKNKSASKQPSGGMARDPFDLDFAGFSAPMTSSPYSNEAQQVAAAKSESTPKPKNRIGKNARDSPANRAQAMGPFETTFACFDTSVHSNSYQKDQTSSTQESSISEKEQGFTEFNDNSFSNTAHSDPQGFFSVFSSEANSKTTGPVDTDGFFEVPRPNPREDMLPSQKPAPFDSRGAFETSNSKRHEEKFKVQPQDPPADSFPKSFIDHSERQTGVTMNNETASSVAYLYEADDQSTVASSSCYLSSQKSHSILGSYDSDERTSHCQKVNNNRETSAADGASIASASSYPSSGMSSNRKGSHLKSGLSSHGYTDGEYDSTLSTYTSSETSEQGSYVSGGHAVRTSESSHLTSSRKQQNEELSSDNSRNRFKIDSIHSDGMSSYVSASQKTQNDKISYSNTRDNLRNTSTPSFSNREQSSVASSSCYISSSQKSQNDEISCDDDSRGHLGNPSMRSDSDREQNSLASSSCYLSSSQEPQNDEMSYDASRDRHGNTSMRDYSETEQNSIISFSPSISCVASSQKSKDHQESNGGPARSLADPPNHSQNDREQNNVASLHTASSQKSQDHQVYFEDSHGNFEKTSIHRHDGREQRIVASSSSRMTSSQESGDDQFSSGKSNDRFGSTSSDHDDRERNSVASSSSRMTSPRLKTSQKSQADHLSSGESNDSFQSTSNHHHDDREQNIVPSSVLSSSSPPQKFRKDLASSEDSKDPSGHGQRTTIPIIASSQQPRKGQISSKSLKDQNAASSYMSPGQRSYLPSSPNLPKDMASDSNDPSAYGERASIPGISSSPQSRKSHGSSKASNDGSDASHVSLGQKSDLSSPQKLRKDLASSEHTSVTSISSSKQSQKSQNTSEESKDRNSTSSPVLRSKKSRDVRFGESRGNNSSHTSSTYHTQKSHGSKESKARSTGTATDIGSYTSSKSRSVFSGDSKSRPENPSFNRLKNMFENMGNGERSNHEIEKCNDSKSVDNPKRSVQPEQQHSYYQTKPRWRSIPNKEPNLVEDDNSKVSEQPEQKCVANGSEHAETDNYQSKTFLDNINDDKLPETHQQRREEPGLEKKSRQNEPSGRQNPPKRGGPISDERAQINDGKVPENQQKGGGGESILDEHWQHNELSGLQNHPKRGGYLRKDIVQKGNFSSRRGAWTERVLPENDAIIEPTTSSDSAEVSFDSYTRPKTKTKPKTNIGTDSAIVNFNKFTKPKNRIQHKTNTRSRAILESMGSSDSAETEYSDTGSQSSEKRIGIASFSNSSAKPIGITSFSAAILQGSGSTSHNGRKTGLRSHEKPRNFSTYSGGAEDYSYNKGGSHGMPTATGLPNNAIVASMLFRTQYNVDTSAVDAKIKAKEDEEKRMDDNRGDVPRSIQAVDGVSCVSSFSEDTGALQEAWRKPTRDLLDYFANSRRTDFDGKKQTKQKQRREYSAAALYEA